MEGLTPEQAAAAAQWATDIGPPGPVSYIMHLIQSQETQDEESAISGQGEDQSLAPAASTTDLPTSTPTLDGVSDSTAMSSSFQTSASTLSTSQDTFSSATSDIPSITSDPASFTTDQPLFSLDISTTSSISTSVSAQSTGILSYEPIGGSISSAPTSTSRFDSSSSSSSSRTIPTDIGSHATETASSDMINMSHSRKQAIVGGLAGAIGALIVVGILLCFCLRRRHRRSDDDEDAEDGLKPVKPPMTAGTKASTVRLWNTLGREPARSTPEISRARTPSPVDGSIIRISTENWSRPFVRREGMRESLEPAPLRVANGSSKSSTPQQEEDKPGVVRKHRSALAAFIQDGARSNSRNTLKRGPISYPKPVSGEPVYSSKATVDSVAETQSVGSLPSDTSSLMVVQQPPVDPFYASTTVLSTMEEVAPPMEPTTTKQPELNRTYSHFGKNANPFRTQIVPSVALPPRIFSYNNPNFRASNVTNVRDSNVESNYSRRETIATIPKRESDQFDLLISPDQMPAASGILAKTAEYEKREQGKKMERKEEEQREQREVTPADRSSPNWRLYEGT